MTLGKSINKLRTNANMSQEQFADLFGVSQQSVQKWETDAATPELSKLVSIAKYFGVSLDALILGNGNRIVEELKSTKEINPQYQSIADSEFYSSYILNEYQQSLEEGLDIEQYSDLFKAVSHLPKNEIKKKIIILVINLYCFPTVLAIRGDDIILKNPFRSPHHRC